MSDDNRTEDRAVRRKSKVHRATRRGALSVLCLVILLGAALPMIPGTGISVSYSQRHVAAAGQAPVTQGSGIDVVIHYVDWEADDGGNGTSWEEAFDSLQDALEVAISGEDIWVAAGVYLPSVEHGGVDERYKSFQLLNGVGIYGGFDPTVGDIGWEDRDWVNNETVLSGDIGTPGDFYDNSYHIFYHPVELGLDNTAILDGFTVSEGNADAWTGGDDTGAGMLNIGASPTLANCIFELNEAWDKGGAIYNDTSSPHVTDCTFRSNKSWLDGGAIFNHLSAPTVEGTTFVDNWAWGVGGGVVNHNSSPTYTDCTFLQNEAEEGGAGMMNWGGSATVTNCSFVRNLASLAEWGEGGGVGNSAANVTLTNCTFADNYAALSGGGLYNWAGSVTMTNCSFYGNVTDGEGGAIFNYPNAAPFIGNSILWGDSPDEIAGGTPDVTYSDIQGTYPGEGNINADPAWFDPDNGDFHLNEGSLCIDAGTNDAPELPPTDFEGDDRVLDGDGDGVAIVDMGVDEAPEVTVEPVRVYMPLILRNH